MKKMKKIFASLLALAMAVTMVPMTAFADEGEVPSTSNTIEDQGLVLSKSATLEDDGTYTIDLSAYATGEVSIIESQVPTDVVLLLDQSGSMAKSIGNEYKPVNNSRLTYKDVYDNTTGYNKPTYYILDDNGQYYDISVKRTVKSSNYQYTITANGKTIGQANQSGSTTVTDVQFYTSEEISRESALKTAAKAFIDTTAEKNSSIEDESQKHRISIVKFAGTESTAIGNDKYEESSYYQTNYYNYTQIVKELTTVDNNSVATLKSTIDSLSEAGATSVDYGLNRAEAALANPSSDRAKIIILFTDGEPNHSSDFDKDVAKAAINKAKELKNNNTTIFTISVIPDADTNDTASDMNKYMNAVSSNYPKATAEVNTSLNGWYYQTSLDVTWGTGSTSNGYYKKAGNASELESVFKAISSSIGGTTVTLDETAILRDIAADGFSIPADATISVKTADYNGNGEFAAPVDFAAAVTNENNTVNVTGFDYAENYVADAAGSLNANGKKLLVQIKGVLPTEDAVKNEEIDTNNAASGIYSPTNDGNDLVLAFPQPKTILTDKAYVLDYAKPFRMNLADLNMTSGSAYGNFSKADATPQYGSLSADMTYSPNTTQWNGYDKFYVLGKADTSIKASANTSKGNLWGRLSVIPANNVYYEDSFTSVESDGTVDIMYGGNWEVVPEEGASDNNQADAVNDEHGMITDLADDTTYSDGSAHLSSTKGATATFTFTGKGADVYSRTNMKTGMVRAILYSFDENDTPVSSKIVRVDNLAQSGDYYQVPTVSFNNLDYGKYKVVLTVGSTSDGRSEYYLDGIRIYNPLSDAQESDAIVSDAYADELGATFYEVRDILLAVNTDAGNALVEGNDITTEGAVFIDYIPDEEGNSSANVGTYNDYGPKNEVYLGTNQAIAFTVDTSVVTKVSVGLSAPAGETAVQYTNGTGSSPVAIGAASDLYYVIQPDENGRVLIKNTGANLLAISKIKLTGVSSDSARMATQPVSSYLAYADEFDSLPVIGDGDVIDQPEITVPDQNTDDVTIDNPDSEEEVEVPVEKPANSWLSNLFSGIKKIFGR